MADQVSEILEAPKEFVHDGMQFMKRCQKPDQKEFIKISQAVGVGSIETICRRVGHATPGTDLADLEHIVLIMGFVGYIVKLIHIPVNNILVGGA